MGFISDPGGDPGDPPGFELLRSITPFGGPAHLEADITDFANAHPGEHVLRSYINSWADGAGQVSGSAGGWHLSVRIDGEPGPAPATCSRRSPCSAATSGSPARPPRCRSACPRA
ncbi:hypothetical protein [Nannocystis pusilla]|uniref:hypothetical protein n=1 Tax=Nannocystis pusilla TaxID=889268 RepID=UPI003B7DB50C